MKDNKKLQETINRRRGGKRGFSEEAPINENSAAQNEALLKKVAEAERKAAAAEKALEAEKKAAEKKIKQMESQIPTRKSYNEKSAPRTLSLKNGTFETFRDRCKSEGVKMSEVLESLLSEYLRGK